MKHPMRQLIIALLLALVILPVCKSSWQETTAQAPLPAVPAELGAPPERIPQAPGRFYELPPRWGRETVGHSRPNIAGLISGGYITPAEVAENYRNLVLRDVEGNEFCLGGGEMPG